MHGANGEVGKKSFNLSESLSRHGRPKYFSRGRANILVVSTVMSGLLLARFRIVEYVTQL